MMKLLVLGATGRTGKWVLEEALQAGYIVHALVRAPQNVKRSHHPRLQLFTGSALDKTSVENAFKGCESIISVLNISRANDFPWSPLRTPPNLLSLTIQNLLATPSIVACKRIVICSAWGVAETKKDIPFWFRWLINSSNIGHAYRDHERQEALLMSGAIPWTIVRPVGLTNGPLSTTIQESYDNFPKPNLVISRKSVANYLVNALKRTDLIHKAPVISTGK